MKTTTLRTWAAVGLALLTTVATRASADQAAAAAQREKTCTGVVTSVNPNDRVLRMRWLLVNRNFNLGDNCVFINADKGTGTINGLRPGQKVTLSYQNARGVLVTDRVEDRPMRYEGTVKAIDPEAHRLTLHLRAWDKTLMIGDDCTVMLRDSKVGTLADVKPGHYVTVVYETPSGMATARQIAQTSATFIGTLNAMDASDRTIKARHLAGQMKFNLADGCAIMVKGKPDARLNDLKLGDKVTLSYDQINGVNVVNRIAQVEEQSNTLAQRSPNR